MPRHCCTYLSDSQGISKPGIVWLAHVPALADKYSLGIQSFSDMQRQLCHDLWYPGWCHY